MLQGFHRVTTVLNNQTFIHRHTDGIEKTSIARFHRVQMKLIARYESKSNQLHFSA